MGTKFSSTCFELTHRLKELLMSRFSPAEVVVDNTSDIDTAYGHMVFSKRTLCNPSTFCLWATLASNKGYLADSPIFFGRSHPQLQNLTHLIGVPFLNMQMIIDRRYS